MKRNLFPAGFFVAALILSLGVPKATAADLAPDFVSALHRLAPGSALVVPLPDGSMRRGEVRHTRRDDDGWTRVGGALADGGSFSFSTRDGATAGLVQLPREGRAWQIRTQPSGAPAFIERRLGDVVCVGLPQSQGFAPVEEIGRASCRERV